MPTTSPMIAITTRLLVLLVGVAQRGLRGREPERGHRCDLELQTDLALQVQPCLTAGGFRETCRQRVLVADRRDDVRAPQRPGVDRDGASGEADGAQVGQSLPVDRDRLGPGLPETVDQLLQVGVEHLVAGAVGARGIVGHHAYPGPAHGDGAGAHAEQLDPVEQALGGGVAAQLAGLEAAYLALRGSEPRAVTVELAARLVDLADQLAPLALVADRVARGLHRGRHHEDGEQGHHQGADERRCGGGGARARASRRSPCARRRTRSPRPSRGW